MDRTTESHWRAVRVERPRARWPWPCDACGRVIGVGEQHRKISGLRDDAWVCLRTCTACSTEEAA